MQYKLTTLRFWLVEFWVTFCKRAEQLLMSSFEVQSESGVECVSCLVAQDAHAFGVAPSLNFQHLLTLQLHKSRMRQVERDRNAWNTIRGEPLFREPHMWFETNTTIVELTVKPLDVWLEE